MPNYLISFRISDEADYDKKYAALIADMLTTATRWWDETTSFLIIEDETEIDVLAEVAKSAIDPSSDTVLIRQLDAKRARVVGVVHDEDLFVLMPYCKRV